MPTNPSQTLALLDAGRSPAMPAGQRSQDVLPLNIRDFGGGNGVDDTLALRAAVAIATLTGGGDILLPALTGSAPYLFSGNVAVPEGIRLLGTKTEKWYSIIKRTADITVFTSVATLASRYHGIQFERLKFDGNNVAWTSDFIQCQYVAFMRFTNCRFFQITGRAVKLTQVQDSYFHGISFDHCGASDGTPVVEINSGPDAGENCNSLHFSECDFESNKGINIKALLGAGATNNSLIRLHRCKFESTLLTHEFLNFANSQSVWITASEFIANNIAGGAAAPIATAGIVLSSCTSVYIHAQMSTTGTPAFANWQYFIQATSTSFLEIAGWMSEAATHLLTGTTFINGVTSMNNCLVNRLHQAVNSGNKPLLGGTFRLARGIITGAIGTGYSASITSNAATGDVEKITVTDGVAFTINAPINTYRGMVLIYDILNSSGGVMGAITWNAVFKLAGAFTNPANTKRRTIMYYYDGANWVELNRAAADI